MVFPSVSFHNRRYNGREAIHTSALDDLPSQLRDVITLWTRLSTGLTWPVDDDWYLGSSGKKI